jgi:hypothetical protein
MFETIINYLYRKFVNKHGDSNMADVVAEGQGVAEAPAVVSAPTPVGQAVVRVEAAVGENPASLLQAAENVVGVVVSEAKADVAAVIKSVEDKVTEALTERADKLLDAVKGLLVTAGHDLGPVFDDAAALARAFSSNDDDAADKVLDILKVAGHDFGHKGAGILAFVKKHL